MNLRPSGFGLLILILVITVSSWITIHLLAILGIFIAITYPIFWLVAPKQTVCLLCRADREGTRCPFCRRTIIAADSKSPRNFTSAVLNGSLILLFSLVSAGIVYGEKTLLARLGFPPTAKTVSFIIPTRGQYRLGEIFPMKIEIAGIKTPINAVQTDLGFDQDKLEVVDISTDNSFASIFIQKEINNASGYARLTGGLPNPGYFSDKGLFGTVYFKTKSPGVVRIEFLPSSMVLANDGRGTNVLRDLTPVSYLVLPEKISPEEETMQSQVSLQSSTLGEATESTQMKFFPETSILGAEVGTDTKNSSPPADAAITLDVLAKLDALLLSPWTKLFSLH